MVAVEILRQGFRSVKNIPAFFYHGSTYLVIFTCEAADILLCSLYSKFKNMKLNPTASVVGSNFRKTAMYSYG